MEVQIELVSRGLMYETENPHVVYGWHGYIPGLQLDRFSRSGV